MRQLNSEDDEFKKRFTPKFISSLMESSWRGNVRELRHYIQREYYLSDGEWIDGGAMVPEKYSNKIDLEKSKHAGYGEAVHDRSPKIDQGQCYRSIQATENWEIYNLSEIKGI